MHGEGRIVIEKSVREEVYHKFGGHCAYCGVELGDKFHVDHVIPFAGGGPEDIVNYFPACRHCNTLKNALSLAQFKNTIEQYHTKCGAVVADRFGSIKIMGPIKVTFYYETQGYTFPEDLVKTMMTNYYAPPAKEDL